MFDFYTLTYTRLENAEMQLPWKQYVSIEAVGLSSYLLEESLDFIDPSVTSEILYVYDVKLI